MTDWDTRSLGSVATLQRGFDLPTRLRRVGTVPIVSSSGISGWHDRAMVKAPGVVTGRYGTVGEVFYQEADFWPLNTTLWVSNFHANDERFVYYMLQRVDFATHSGKSGVPGVNRNDLHTELVSLPRSTGEQRAIAAALADADDLIATTERLIAKKQAIKQGMMQQLLTGRTRLPGFTGKWTETRLGDILKFQAGFPFPSHQFSEEPSGVRLVRNRDLRSDDATVFIRGHVPSDYMLNTGDVLVGMDGDFEPVIWQGGRAALNQRVGRLRFSSRSHAGFIAYALVAPLKDLEYGTGATTVKHLSHSDVENLMMTIPPVAEQAAIAQGLIDSDAAIDALHVRLAKARAIKQGMMQQLLTGRTRLPVAEVVAP